MIHDKKLAMFETSEATASSINGKNVVVGETSGENITHLCSFPSIFVPCASYK